MSALFSATSTRLSRDAAHRQREGPRHAAHRDDAESALLEQAAERREGEEPRMRQVEDAALAVVELAEEQHQAR